MLWAGFPFDQWESIPIDFALNVIRSRQRMEMERLVMSARIAVWGDDKTIEKCLRTPSKSD